MSMLNIDIKNVKDRQFLNSTFSVLYKDKRTAKPSINNFIGHFNKLARQIFGYDFSIIDDIIGQDKYINRLLCFKICNHAKIKICHVVNTIDIDSDNYLRYADNAFVKCTNGKYMSVTNKAIYKAILDKIKNDKVFKRKHGFNQLLKSNLNNYIDRYVFNGTMYINSISEPTIINIDILNDVTNFIILGLTDKYMQYGDLSKRIRSLRKFDIARFKI